MDGEEIRPHEIQKLADEIGISYKHVLGRVIEHGAEFVDKPAPLAPHDWSESTAVAIDSELRAAAEDGVVATDRMLEIADRHDVTGVSDRIRWLGLAYVNGLGEIVDDDYERNKAAAKAAKFRQWDADAMVAASRKGIVADSQYGVLQGAANVAGGCATGWGILFALLAIVLVIFAISQVFSAIF